MHPPPSGVFSTRHLFYSDRNVHVSMKDEMLPPPCVLKMWFQVHACLVPGLVFWIFWSHPEGRNKINIAITLRLVDRAGWQHVAVPANSVTHSLLSFLLSSVCLSLFVSFTSSSHIITRMSWLWVALWGSAAALGHHLEASGCSVSFFSGT